MPAATDASLHYHQASANADEHGEAKGGLPDFTGWNHTEASLYLKPHSCLAFSYFLTLILLSASSIFSSTKSVEYESLFQALLLGNHK